VRIHVKNMLRVVMYIKMERQEWNVVGHMIILAVASMPEIHKKVVYLA